MLFVSTFAVSDAAERAREYDPKTITLRRDDRKVKQPTLSPSAISATAATC